MSDPDYTKCVGVQIYAKKTVAVTGVFPPAFGDDGKPDAAVVEALRDKGVVFYRDSDGPDGIVVEQGFSGRCYYSQFFIHEKTNEVASVQLLNTVRNVTKMTAQQVHWQKG